MPQDDRGTGSQSAATTASTGSWGRNTSACNHEQLSKHETCQEGRKVESRLEMQRAPSQGWCWHRGGCVFLGAQSSDIPKEAGSPQEWEGSIRRFCSISASPLINSSPQRKHAPAAPRHIGLETGSRAPRQAGPSSSHKTHVRPEHAKPL